MISTNASVWFVCKTCRGSFRKLDEFLEHKKHHHFQEFQSTNCIIFEERIPGNEHIVSASSTAQGLERKTQNESLINNPPKIKFENNYYNNKDGDQSDPTEFPWQTFHHNAELIKTEREQSIDQDFVDNNNEELSHLKIISSETITSATLLDFKFETSSELKSTCNLQNSISDLTPWDFRNLINTASRPFIDSANSSEILRKNFIYPHHKPRVLLKRLKFKNIKNSTVSTNLSNGKFHITSTDSQERNLTENAGEIEKNKTNLIQCQLCLGKFNSKPKLEVHISSCYLLHPHRHSFCVLCNKKFAKKFNFERHISRRHMPMKPESNRVGLHSFQCPRKPNSSKNVKAVKENSSEHSKLVYVDFQKFKCPHIYCEKSFTTEYHLLKHLITHSDLVTKTLSN